MSYDKSGFEIFHVPQLPSDFQILGDDCQIVNIALVSAAAGPACSAAEDPLLTRASPCTETRPGGHGGARSHVLCGAWPRAVPACAAALPLHRAADGRAGAALLALDRGSAGAQADKVKARTRTGGLGSAFARSLGGESLFKVHWKNEDDREGFVGFTAPIPANIIPMNMADFPQVTNGAHDGFCEAPCCAAGAAWRGSLLFAFCACSLFVAPPLPNRRG